MKIDQDGILFSDRWNRNHQISFSSYPSKVYKKTLPSSPLSSFVVPNIVHIPSTCPCPFPAPAPAPGSPSAPSAALLPVGSCPPAAAAPPARRPSSSQSGCRREKHKKPTVNIIKMFGVECWALILWFMELTCFSVCHMLPFNTRKCIELSLYLVKQSDSHGLHELRCMLRDNPTENPGHNTHYAHDPDFLEISGFLASLGDLDTVWRDTLDHLHWIFKGPERTHQMLQDLWHFPVSRWTHSRAPDYTLTKKSELSPELSTGGFVYVATLGIYPTCSLCAALERGSGPARGSQPALCGLRGPSGPEPRTAASWADAFSPAGGAAVQRARERENRGILKTKPDALQVHSVYICSCPRFSPPSSPSPSRGAPYQGPVCPAWSPPLAASRTATAASSPPCPDRRWTCGTCPPRWACTRRPPCSPPESKQEEQIYCKSVTWWTELMKHRADAVDVKPYPASTRFFILHP